MECPAATGLPHDPDVAGDAALWGGRMHAWKLFGSADGDPQVEERVAVAAAHGLTRDVIWPGGVHEVTYVRDTDGVRRVQLTPDDVERLREVLPPEQMIGTADWEETESYPLPWQDDLKTGRFPPTLDSPQLLWYADAMWEAEGRPAGGVMVSVTHWPRYPKGEPPYRIGPEVIPPSRLRRFRSDLDRARDAALASDAKDVQNPGPWCTYCTARRYCAAVGGALSRYQETREPRP